MSKATILFENVEPLGFHSHVVEYHITGHVRWGRSHGNRYDPPDDDEVHIEDVVRYDPFTDEKRMLKTSEWPFSDEATMRINQAILEQATPDFDDFPEDDDYGSRFDDV